MCHPADTELSPQTLDNAISHTAVFFHRGRNCFLWSSVTKIGVPQETELDRVLFKSYITDSSADVPTWILNILRDLMCCGSVHYSTILKEKPNKMQQYQNFIIPYFKLSSTCFGRHTAHHHELHKQSLVLHNIVEGCRTCSCWTLSGSVRSFRLLIMGGV
jgi:hypothetical protein